MNDIVIGIDPGLGGGLAFSLAPYSNLHADAVKMPDTPKGIYDLLQSLVKDRVSPICYCEQVGTYRPGNSAVSACKFAKHTGILEMALIALQIPSFYVTPNKWMTSVLGTVPKEKPERKKFIKNRMEQQYPQLKVTLLTADALGILTYGINLVTRTS
jgi:Holliday junction resolvasome RuvABC endonuclease subunit